MKLISVAAKNNLKNIFGWTTNRKVVIFSVDDYGNVRLNSRQARSDMDKAGLKVLTRFDAFDTLETREDLEMLYESLSVVKDRNGRHAMFTPFALSCNINFEKMKEENYRCFRYELLPDTYEKLSADDHHAYEGAWDLWHEGIRKGLMVPQFHGREHLNLKVFEEKLAKLDHEVMTALNTKSYTSISDTGYPSISFPAAFSFWDSSETERFPEIIDTGLKAFKKIYGSAATVFTPPVHQFPDFLEPSLVPHGIKVIDKPYYRARHQGRGKYKNAFAFTGYNKKSNLIYLVRNVFFEPSYAMNIDWVNYAFKQIEAAFRWNKPAIISSHRVNFCGHIDPGNRLTGLNALKELLKKITARWADAEFMSAGELGALIESSSPDRNK